MASSLSAGVSPATAASLPGKFPVYQSKAGKLGMRALLEKYGEETPDWTRERAAKGGTALSARYGRDYFRFLVNRRWAKHRQRLKEKEQEAKQNG